MPFSNTFAPQFSLMARARGDDYFRRGRVELVLDGLERTQAWVQGNDDDYDVEITWGRNGDWDEARCSCPRFGDGHLCKHLWAVLLAVEEARGEGPGPKTKGSRRAKGARPVVVQPPPAWKLRLDAVEQDRRSRSDGRDWSAALTARRRRIWYVIDVPESTRWRRTLVRFLQRELRATGEWGSVKPLGVDESVVASLADPQDQALLRELHTWDRFDESSTESCSSRYDRYYGSQRQSTECRLPEACLERLLRTLCATGRCTWRLGDQQSPEDRPILTWDDGPAWRLQLVVEETQGPDEAQGGRDWTLSGRLVRGAGESREERPLREAVFVDPAGAVLFEDRLAAFVDERGSAAWLGVLRKDDVVRIPCADRDAFRERLGRTVDPTQVRWPEGISGRDEQAVVGFRPRLRILPAKDVDPFLARKDLLFATIGFLYGTETPTCFAVNDATPGRFEAASSTWIGRDSRREQEALAQLVSAKVQPALNHGWRRDGAHVQFAHQRLGEVVRTLAGAGWTVEADGHAIRTAGTPRISVRSGIDWFDLEARFDFGGVSAGLPELLAALKQGERFVRLGDGSQGMLPEDWLTKYGGLAGLGEAHTEAESGAAVLRFKPSQAMLLDALLAAQPAAETDRDFRTFVRRLRSFGGVKPKSVPRTFRGTLRDYQREGLSWLNFLCEFRLGGCLADDMGLGKTVQVLALLESRRTRRLKPDEQRRPSIVVVPKSLVFNWIDEAARFAPGLRTLNYTGKERRRGDFRDVDLIVTTYGTLRRDVATFGETVFDYAVLDEAQAVKNPDSVSAKACRLLRADHRLAMSGTPVENHLGELWSLFEFLNPGLLGNSAAFRRLTDARSNGEAKSNGEPSPARPATAVPGSAADPSDEASSNGDLPDRAASDRNSSLAILAAALRPYLLRRTKEQVLTELPEKTEQTVLCEMPHGQRKLYDELRDHYRLSLQRRIAVEGLEKSKIHVLEALLRLRQVACHPGLIDPLRIEEPDAKLETLLERLDEVVAEGHKALVFSQFTSLLAIVRRRLDARRTTYEYLDGRTRNRKEKVERFQTDPACPLFLISLKAGGHGLNLTAADYVFVLDPWWNPAVEAQAIDRAHRLGQTRPVFAYRLICRDTVEQRILDLQREKRELADAIVSADAGLVGSLTADDLRLLLD